MVDDNETRRRVFGARKPLEQLVCFRSVERERSLHVSMGIPRTKIDKLNWWHGINLNKRDHRTTLASLFVAFYDRDKNIWQSDKEKFVNHFSSLECNLRSIKKVLIFKISIVHLDYRRIRFVLNRCRGEFYLN